jgi:hypothetical protein
MFHKRKAQTNLKKSSEKEEDEIEITSATPIEDKSKRVKSGLKIVREA